jgi:putative salt-induced outer membrane protein YdiY
MHISKRHVAVLLAAMVLAPVAAAAQTTPPPPPPKQELSAQAAFVGTTGNSKETTLSAGADYIARPDVWTIKDRFAVIRGETDNIVTSESWLFGMRAERPINARIATFGEYAYFRDTFAGIDNRNGVTGGLMFTLVKDARHTLTADGGIGYLNEKRLAGDDVSSGTYSGGAAYKLQLSENADVTDEFRFLGVFNNSDDWRISNTVAVTAKLTSVFSLKFSNTVRHLNFPPTGFISTDTVTSVALVMSVKSKATAK